MARTLKLGPILLNGKHAKTGTTYQPDQAISFGEGNNIRWVVVNGLLVADRPLLINISWDDLDKQDFIFGKPVTIGRQKFKCRLLKIGSADGVPNEWNHILNVVGEDNSLWHWDGVSFWGQECPTLSERAYCGYHSAREWYCGSSFLRHTHLGFRPALEPVPSDHLASGEQVCAIGGQSALYGKLLEVTDYDALVKPEDGFKPVKADIGKRYTKLQDGTFVIDRTRMTVQSIREDGK